MNTVEQVLEHFKNLGDLDKLTIIDDQGFLKLRIGFVVSLFFIDGNTPEKRLGFAHVMRSYYETFKEHLTHYVETQARRIKLIKNAAFLDQYDVDAVRAPVDDPNITDINHDDLNLFSPHILGVAEGEELSTPPFYYCGGTSFPLDPWFPAGSVSYFNAHIPASWVYQHGHPALAALVQQWCALLKPTHGTAGLGTLFEIDGNYLTNGIVSFPFLKRFPGLDYNDSSGWSAKSMRAGNRVIRTTNWLSAIDDGFIAQLGGLQKLKSELGEACLVHVYDGGVIIQAGPQAELGDINHGIIPEHYRTVARVLKPLRFEDYHTPLLIVPEPLDGLEETKAWIARFD